MRHLVCERSVSSFVLIFFLALPESKMLSVVQMECPVKTSLPPPISRRSGNFPPSLWDDGYIQSLQNDFTDEHADRIEKLKGHTRQLIEEEKGVVEQLELVDSLQQLGLAYHFEEEIIHVLTGLSKSMDDVLMIIEHELYAKAQLFRLLREQGFKVSQDVFNAFKNGDGSFKSCMVYDAKGLLSLYQASYFGMEDEKTMDEARDFTTNHLNKILKGGQGSLEPYLGEQIIYALNLPLNLRSNRTHCRWFIEKYEKYHENMNHILLELAKLDFNMVQSIHKRELKELSRWWTELDICGDKLSFSRDRLVENYLASTLWVFEPKSWRCREALTKFNNFITIIDDVYDIYGSLEELEKFTDVVERWDLCLIEKLPEYMKICFLALFNTANTIAYEVMKDKGVNIIPYIRRMCSDQCNAYLVEAKWYHKSYIPNFEEYLENAQITVSTHLGLTIAYCVNEDVTIDTLKYFKSYPTDLMHSPSMIIRICNDMATSIDELERGDVSKSIQCYMHEKGVPEMLAREHLWEMVILHWKRLNGEKHLGSSRIEKLLRSVALNIARTAHLFYHHGDGFGKNHNREIKDHIISLFINPILI